MNAQQLKLGNDYLDKIYETSIEITKAYNSEYIPLNTLYQVLERSKLKKNKKIKAFVDGWNKMIDTLYITCMKYCDQFDLHKRLPMIVLKKFIGVLKENLG